MTGLLAARQESFKTSALRTKLWKWTETWASRPATARRSPSSTSLAREVTAPCSLSPRLSHPLTPTAHPCNIRTVFCTNYTSFLKRFVYLLTFIVKPIVLHCYLEHCFAFINIINYSVVCNLLPLPICIILQIEKCLYGNVYKRIVGCFKSVI